MHTRSVANAREARGTRNGDYRTVRSTVVRMPSLPPECLLVAAHASSLTPTAAARPPLATPVAGRKLSNLAEPSPSFRRFATRFASPSPLCHCGRYPVCWSILADVSVSPHSVRSTLFERMLRAHGFQVGSLTTFIRRCLGKSHREKISS